MCCAPESCAGIWEHAVCAKEGNLGTCVLQELDLVLEEDFLDLLAMMVREMPNEELWQMPSSTSGTSTALEAGVAGASILTVGAHGLLSSCPPAPFRPPNISTPS